MAQEWEYLFVYVSNYSGYGKMAGQEETTIYENGVKVSEKVESRSDFIIFNSCFLEYITKLGVTIQVRL